MLPRRLTEAVLRPTYTLASVARPACAPYGGVSWPDWPAGQHIRLCEWPVPGAVYSLTASCAGGVSAVARIPPSP